MTGPVALLGAGVLLVAVLVRRRLLLITVSGASMEPAYADGDRVLVRRTTLAGVRRGSVVVLTAAPGSPASDPPFRMKRAAAVPGDRVPAGIPVAARLVPPGRLVVLGDNSERSADSRTAGFLPAADVIGVVIRRLDRR